MIWLWDNERWYIYIYLLTFYIQVIIHIYIYIYLFAGIWCPSWIFMDLLLRLPSQKNQQNAHAPLPSRCFGKMFLFLFPCLVDFLAVPSQSTYCYMNIIEYRKINMVSLQKDIYQGVKLSGIFGVRMFIRQDVFSWFRLARCSTGWNSCVALLPHSQARTTCMSCHAVVIAEPNQGWFQNVRSIIESWLKGVFEIWGDH